jgi:hypothetical protein
VLADGIIDLIGVEIAARGVRPVELTPAGWHLATASRQVLNPHEAELLALTWNTGLPLADTGIRGGHPRISAAAAWTVLRAVGVPPHIAARFRLSLRLTSQREAER